MFVAGSYNIHECVGVDGRRDPERISRVIMSLEVDLIGLQEVDSRSAGPPPSDQLAYLSKATGLHAVAGPTVWRPDGRYGNALLAKRRILSIRHHDLSYPGHQPRAAIDAQVDIDGRRTARVLVTHFGLGLAERRYQLRKLLELLDHDHSRYTLLLADINEWMPGSVVIRRLNATLGRSSSRRTFPSRWPLFPLDRIWMRPKDILLETSVSDTFLGRTASDHLPLRAKIALP